MQPRALPLTTLRDAMKGTARSPLAVCAWVTWFSSCRQSTGEDLYMLLHLSDESLSGVNVAAMTKRPPAGDRDPLEPPYVTCALFGPQHMLPQLDVRGSPKIIYLHQTRMIVFKKEHQLRVQLRCSSTSQAGDAFSVYSAAAVAAMAAEGANAGLPPPISTSHGNEFVGRFPIDMERIQEVRRWAEVQLPAWLGRKAAAAEAAEVNAPATAVAPAAPQVPTALPAREPHEGGGVGGRERAHAIRELVPPLAADGATPVAGPMAPVTLICRVLAVDFSYYPDFYVAHVWDGTDAYPAPLVYSSTPPQHDTQLRPQPSGQKDAAAAAGPPAKRARTDEGGKAVAADDSANVAVWGGGDDEGAGPLPSTPLAHSCRLHMPLSSIAQLAAGGDGGGDGGTAAALGGDSDYRSGWEVMSAAVARQEMPPAGSSVPLVLPAAAFHLAPESTPPQEAAAEVQAVLAPEPAPAGDGQPQAQAQPLPRPGDWVQLKGVVPRFVEGQLQLAFLEGSSSLELRPDGATTVEGEEVDPALSTTGGVAALSHSAPADPSAWLARVCRPWQALPLRTLRQVLMQQDACDCAPCRVLVRVMAVRNPPLPLPAPPVPTDGGAAAAARGAACGADGALSEVALHELQRAILPAGKLRLEQEVVGTRLDRGGNGRTYALALLLQDATASLRAVVVGGAANLFLWYLPPPNEGGSEAASSKAAAGPARKRQPQSPGGSQPSAAAATPSRGVTTRSRAKAAATPVVPAAAPAAAAQAVPQGEAPPELQDGGPGPNGAELGAGDGLLATLRWLSEQRVPGGAWMEAVLRPLYLDRRNPWQSAVYSLEHTVLQVPDHLRPPGGRSPRGETTGPGADGASTTAARKRRDGSPAPSV